MTNPPKNSDQYNIYAKKWEKKISDNKNPAHTYLEKPAMYRKLPPLKGKNILCLGCGSGEECAYLLKKGARKVVGIDSSKAMIEIAKAKTKKADFRVMPIENLDFPQHSFDFIYSSLSMHYLKNWDSVLKKIHRILKKNGVFLFSVNHPLKFGSEIKRTKNKNSFVFGYEKMNQNKKYLTYGDYLNKREIKDIWLNELHVTYYHKPLNMMVKSLLKASFEITDILEPKPTNKAKIFYNNFWGIFNKIPLFIIFEVRKK